MGETGCGKTSLIKFLAQNILEHDFEVLNFHAGFNDKQLKKSIKLLSERANLLIHENKDLWVLFDEINTSECLGSITEIITNHTYMGKKLA